MKFATQAANAMTSVKLARNAMESPSEVENEINPRWKQQMTQKLEQQR